MVFRRNKFRRALAVRPVFSRKVTHEDAGNLAGGLQTILTIVNVVDDIAAVTANNMVPQGAKLPKNIYLSFMLYGDADPSSSTSVNLQYRLAGQVVGTDVPNPGSVDQFAIGNKQVVHQWKALAGNKTAGYPMAFAGIVPVPKTMKYCPLGAVLELRIITPAAGKFCAQAIYNYYR